MFGNHNDLGASVFKEMPEKERKEEVRKLAEGFRNGLPVGIVCKMAETVAGDKKTAKRYLKEFLTADERSAAIASASVAMLPVVRSFLA